MSDQGVFFLILSICVIIITGVVVYVARGVVLTLRRLDSILADVEATTHDIDSVRQGVKTGVLSLVSSYLDRSQKDQGGDSNEKR